MTFKLVIPMAGAGSRFAEQGYDKPKPLIDVNGSPMFVRATENIVNDVCNGIELDNIIYVIDADMDRKYGIHKVIRYFYPQAKIVGLYERTQGAACTVKAAGAYLHPTDSVIVANCDQLVDVDSTTSSSFKDMTERYASGMAVFHCPERDPKWSYAQTSESGMVTQVAEKNPISDLATVGIYYWKTTSMMMKSIDIMMLSNDRVNNEFYLCPAFNYTIEIGHSCGTFMVDKMHGLGTPEDLEQYICYQKELNSISTTKT